MNSEKNLIASKKKDPVISGIIVKNYFKRKKTLYPEQSSGSVLKENCVGVSF